MARTAAVVFSFALLAACSKGNQAPPTPPAPHVSVANPLSRDVVDWDEYVGKFEAPQSVNMSARITGVVTQILFRNGQDVKEGQPLFVIDPRPLRAALEQAEAQVASARATLANAKSVAERSTQLVQAQAVSKEELENNQAQVRTAQASLQAAIAAADNARLNLSFTTVRAPVSGRVSDKRVSLGDQVIANQTLLTTVVSLDPIWFSFDGAESFYLKYLRASQKDHGSLRSSSVPIDIKLADETAYNWHGRLQFVDNAINPNTGTIRAHAVVDNPDHFLTPGMFGRAHLRGSTSYKALLVPDEIITSDQSRKIVLVLGQDGKVAQRTVETGPMVDGLRAIRDGLAPTDLVVLDGLAALQPGAKVDPKRAVIKPRAADTSPGAPTVTTPQASTATTAG